MVINKYRIRYTIKGDNNYVTASFGTDIEDAIASFKSGFIRTDTLIITAVDFVSITDITRSDNENE